MVASSSSRVSLFFDCLKLGPLLQPFAALGAAETLSVGPIGHENMSHYCGKFVASREFARK